MPSATPSMMKAVLLNKNKLEIKQVPVPVPGKDQMLIKLETTGVCHTDVHVADGEIKKNPKKNLVLGHEGVGTVEMLGEESQGDDYKIGDRVLVPWLGATCGKCECCISGHEEVCECRQGMGVDVDGTYAEFVIVNPKAVVRLPSTLSQSEAQAMAPMACAGLTTYTALKHSGLRAGQWVAIIGAAGGLGHMAFQFAQAMAFKPICIDQGAKKMEFIAGLGATHTIDASKTKDLETEVEKITHGCGVHASIVLAPCAKAYDEAMQITQRGGTIMCVALPKEPIQLDMFTVIQKELKLKGSLVGDRQDLREALQFGLEGKVRCVVTEFPLDAVAEVHKALKGNTLEGRAILRCCSGKTTPVERKQQQAPVRKQQQTTPVERRA